MHAAHNSGKQWEEPKNPPKPKAVSSTDESKVTPFPTGSNVRAKIVSDLTAEYVAHLELVIKALQKGKTDEAQRFQIWADALKQAIAIANE